MQILLFIVALSVLPHGLFTRAKPDAGAPTGPAVQAPDAGVPLDPNASFVVPNLPAPAVLPPIPGGMGRVAGHVTLNGVLPPHGAPITVVPGDPSSREIKVCGASQPDLSMQLGLNGGVLEAALWALDGPAPARGSRSQAHVAVESCRFAPHVLVITEGTELALVNHDALYQNVTGSGLTSFNFALMLKDHDVPLRLKKPGLLVLESKLRTWMKGYVQVLPTTASSKTDTDGGYFIDLPPGRHVIHLWHERLGEREETIDVAAGATTLKDFRLSPN